MTVRALVRELCRTLRAWVTSRRQARTQAMRSWRRPRGTALRCAALLTVVAVASLSLAWLTWQASASARTWAGGAEPSGDDRRETSLVADDLTRSLVADRTRTTGTTTAAQTPPGGPGGEGGPAAPGIGGTVLSGTAVGAVLLAGLVAAFFILRRYRSKPAPAPDSALGDVQDTAPTAGPDDVEDSPGDGQASSARHPVEHDEGEPEDCSAGDLPVGDDASAAPDVPSAARPPVDRSPTSTPTPTAAVPSDTAGPSARTSSRPEPATYASRERIYERRVAPRIPFECEGRLEGRQNEASVTVLDLSGTGLRCRSFSSWLPKDRDYVQVTFPLDGEAVTLTGQVSWRRTSPEGTELGLQFLRLSELDTQRLRSVCLQSA